MTAKRVFIVLVIISIAFACGFFTAQLYFKQHLADYHKRASAIARARNVDLLTKEIEFLVLSYKRGSGLDESALNTFCTVISSKIQQVQEDRAIIESALASKNQEHAPGLAEAQHIFVNSASQQLQVAKDTAKQMGCK